MGFTHYFTQGKPVSNQQWQNFKNDAQIVIDHAQKKLNIVLMSNDSNAIMLNDDRVNLNGDESCDLDHETFYLAKNSPGFNFCKTARKPYDLVVTSLLLLAQEHMPDSYNITSDGNFNDWQEAMEMNAKLFGRGFKLSESVEYSDDVREYEEQLAKKYPQALQEENVDKFIVNETNNQKNSRFNL